MRDLLIAVVLALDELYGDWERLEHDDGFALDKPAQAALIKKVLSEIPPR